VKAIKLSYCFAEIK